MMKEANHVLKGFSLKAANWGSAIKYLSVRPALRGGDISPTAISSAQPAAAGVRGRRRFECSSKQAASLQSDCYSSTDRKCFLDKIKKLIRNLQKNL